VDMLIQRVDGDGAIGFWTQSRNSYPYVSIYAYFALTKLKQKGLPSALIEKGKTFLKKLTVKMITRAEENKTGEAGVFAQDNVDSKTAAKLAAFALYVLDLMGVPDVEKAKKLLDTKPINELSVDVIAWILPTLMEDRTDLKKRYPDIARYISNSIVEGPTKAHFQKPKTKPNTWGLLPSNVRDDAVMLDTLISVDPKNPLIPKLVQGLLDSRKNNRWLNTQDNTFSLLALDHYFSVYEKVVPSFVADLWIGTGFAGRVEFEGYNVSRKQVRVPMSVMEKEKDPSILVAKTGQGRLYYRFAFQFAPKTLFLPARDCGFVITRQYSYIDLKTDVTVESAEDGKRIIKIRAGARVLVTLKAMVAQPRTHVALVDYLPGGIEPLQEKTSGISSYRSRYRWNHHNLRDERVEAFAEELYSGEHTFSFVARATTVGTFLAPPARAEEMYNPEVYGRSTMDVVIVQ